MAGVVAVEVEVVAVLVVVLVVETDVVVVWEVVVVEVVLVFPQAETRRIITIRIARGMKTFFISAPFKKYLFLRFVPLIGILYTITENSDK